jgi:hypothetical protein
MNSRLGIVRPTTYAAFARRLGIAAIVASATPPLGLRSV